MSTGFKYEKELRFWCQKVLTLVYDDSLSYYELLCKVFAKLNTLIENNNNLPDIIVEEIKKYITPEGIEEILREIFDDLRENIAIADEHESTTATADRIAGDGVWLNDELYYVTRKMDDGDAYIIGGSNPNVEKTTVEQRIKYAIETEEQAREDADNSILNTIGDLNDLTVEDKSDIVSAINEVNSEREEGDTSILNIIGDLNDLTVEDKSNIVSAINEVNSEREEGDTSIINTIGDLDDLTVEDKSNVVSAINEVNSKVDSIWSSDIYINVTDIDPSYELTNLKNDGETDNSSALNALLTYVSNKSWNRCTLFFPSGVYYFNSPINVPSYITFIGEGTLSTSFRTNNVNSNMFTLGGFNEFHDFNITCMDVGSVNSAIVVNCA